MTKQPKNDRGRAIAEGKAVSRYLDVLQEPARRGRPVTQESVEARLAELEQQVQDEDLAPIKRLQVTQRIIDLRETLDLVSNEETREERLVDATNEFVQVAASYSERMGISYAAWRSVGVPAAVLKEAGVTR